MIYSISLAIVLGSGIADSLPVSAVKSFMKEQCQVAKSLAYIPIMSSSCPIGRGLYKNMSKSFRGYVLLGTMWRLQRRY